MGAMPARLRGIRIVLIEDHKPVDPDRLGAVAKVLDRSG